MTFFHARNRSVFQRGFAAACAASAGLLAFVFPFSPLVPALHAMMRVPCVEISADTEWTAEDGPHVISPCGLVDAGATLTLRPGTVVQMAPYAVFSVNGVMRSAGTPEHPVSLVPSSGGASGDAAGSGQWSVHVGNLPSRSGARLEATSTVFSGSNTPLFFEKGASGSLFGMSFSGADTALSVSGSSTVSVARSSFSGNRDFAAFNADETSTVNARSNWWGSPTGPHHAEKNPLGTGDPVSDHVDFFPWLTSDPLLDVPARQNIRPVILIPGVFGSELSERYGFGLQLWPQILGLLSVPLNMFLLDLALRPDGTEDPARPIGVGSMIRSLSVGVPPLSLQMPIFDGLISELKARGYKEDNTLFEFPYDWRRGSEENAALLAKEIDEVAAFTGSDKVDLVAHSMGGIVAKRYLADHGSARVGRLAFIGTPHLGAPKAFETLMFGDDIGTGLLGLVSIVNPLAMKVISQNMPSAYELLPSRLSVDGGGGRTGFSYLSFSLDLAYSFLKYDVTREFLVNSGRNPAMFPIAEATHSVIDSLDLSGVESASFIGCGAPTLGAVSFNSVTASDSSTARVYPRYDVMYESGDETVPIRSASASAARAYYMKGASHARLPSVPEIDQAVASFLLDDVPQIPARMLRDTSSCGGLVGDAVTVRAPLAAPISVDIYDAQEKHVGMLPDGTLERAIPLVPYDDFQGEYFTFLPQGTRYRVRVHKNPGAVASAASPAATTSEPSIFNISLDHFSGSDTKDGSVAWTDVPLASASSTVELAVDLVSDSSGSTATSSGQMASSTGNAPPTLRVDSDGDGVFEQILLPVSSPTSTPLGIESASSTESSSSAPIILSESVTQSSSPGLISPAPPSSMLLVKIPTAPQLNAVWSGPALPAHLSVSAASSAAPVYQSVSLVPSRYHLAARRMRPKSTNRSSVLNSEKKASSTGPAFLAASSTQSVTRGSPNKSRSFLVQTFLRKLVDAMRVLRRISVLPLTRLIPRY